MAASRSRPPLRRTGAAVAAVVLLGATALLAGCATSGPVAAARLHADLAPQLRALSEADRLRVGGSATRRKLVDQAGRPVLLLGVGVNAYVDYGTAAAPSPLTTDDPARMASLGLNAVRLAVSWSRLMPQPGQLSADELARVTETVRQLGAAGIYTVLSMHQDRYAADLGTGTEFDGAPRWAVDTGGLPCGAPGADYYTPCAAQAAAAFYGGARVSGRTLQDWYADAVVALAQAGRTGGPGYAGVDIINEPTDPTASDPAYPSSRWRKQLGALQRTLVMRLRAGGERAPIWVQPQGPRATEPARITALPQLSDRQLVYAPHAYVDVYGTQPGGRTAARVAKQYAAFVKEARGLRAALAIGEFPGAAGGVWDALRHVHRAQQLRAGIGAFSWLWQQPDGSYGWGLLDSQGARRSGTDNAAVLSAPRLLAGAGVRVSGSAERVTLTASRKHSSTADLWLGTRFAAEHDGQTLHVTAASSGVSIDTSWMPQAQLGGELALGTAIRVRLPAGKARATVVLAAPQGASGTPQ
ncbi:MAG: cellulase family glycosylhydrolase [Patulibacter sp.]